MTSPLANRLRLLARYWFVLPPAGLLLGVFVLLAAAWNEEPRPRRSSVSASDPRAERPPSAPVLAPVSVFFVVDCSRHVAADPGPDGRDRRRERVRRFINQSAAVRAVAGRDDRVGVIAFNSRARVVVPLTRPGHVHLADLPTDPEPGRCDVGGALALALESFPEAGPRRIVLITAGVDEVADAEEQARRVRSLGVQIDVLPLGAGPDGVRLLEGLRTLAEGWSYRDDDTALDESARYGDVFRAVPALTPPAAAPDRPPSRPSFVDLPSDAVRRRG